MHFITILQVSIYIFLYLECEFCLYILIVVINFFFHISLELSIRNEVNIMLDEALVIWILSYIKLEFRSEIIFIILDYMS